MHDIVASVARVTDVIAEISAGAKELGISYSNLMNGLKKSGIELDRKILADLAVRDKATFAAIVEQAKSAQA